MNDPELPRKEEEIGIKFKIFYGVLNLFIVGSLIRIDWLSQHPHHIAIWLYCVGMMTPFFAICFRKSRKVRWIVTTVALAIILAGALIWQFAR
jgi:hypothetical protein